VTAASTAVGRRGTTQFLLSRNSARQSNDEATIDATFMICHEFTIPIISTL